MTRDELVEFLSTTEAGDRLEELIRELNNEIQYGLVPRVLDNTYHREYISNWVDDKLHDFVAEAVGILRQVPCPHHIPQLLAHGGNIVCLACEAKCANFIPF